MTELTVVKKPHHRIWACPACDTNNKVTGFPDLLTCYACGIGQLAYLVLLEDANDLLG
jgi:hypothetical protein